MIGRSMKPANDEFDTVGRGAVTPAERLSELMLAENMHRTANALTLATGLLRPSGGRRRLTERTRERALGQIMALAEVSRLLIPPRSSSPVDATELITAVCRAIARSRPYSGCDTLRIDRAPVLVTADTAWLLAVVVAELVENCLKHAFHSRRGGIVVTFYDQEGGLEMCVEDDGEASKGARSSGSGTAIVAAAVEALGGRVARMTSDTGTIVAVDVPTAALTRGLEGMKRCGPTPCGSA